MHTWRVVSRAVEEGAAWGLRRIRKYELELDSDAAQEHVVREIMSALSEVVDFSEEK